MRGEKRSLNAPPTSMKTARGIAAVMSTVPEHQSRAGELDGQPGESDEMELVAQDADGLAGEEETEVPQAQRTKERRSGFGRAG